MSLVAEATNAQLTSGYSVDTWIELRLEAMTKVWQGFGGYSNFFFSEQDAREAQGSFDGQVSYGFAETLWRLAQVSPSKTLGYRDEIVEYVVDIPIDVAAGICRANTNLGSGSVFQYFIPDWDNKLFRTGRRYRFRHKNFPAI